MKYRFDPELIAAAAASPELDVTQPAALRALLSDLGEAVPPYVAPDSVAITSTVISSSDGSPLTVRIIRPRESRPGAPALLWFHGGGFVFGDPAMDFALNARIADELDAVVVSVEYRLAPEHPHPAAVDDGFAALEWMHAEAAALGIDPERIAVGGHSAGGCLAAVIALLARDRSGPVVCFQLLDLPVTDDRGATPSMLAFDDTPVWRSGDAHASWRAYLGDAVGSADYAAPARAADLTGLPPAYVAVAEFDPLRDEGIDYARRLVQAGVSTELHLSPGTFHGSVAAAPEAAVSRSMVDHLVGALARAFGTGLVAERELSAAVTR